MWGAEEETGGVGRDGKRWSSNNWDNLHEKCLEGVAKRSEKTFSSIFPVAWRRKARNDKWNLIRIQIGSMASLPRLKFGCVLFYLLFPPIVSSHQNKKLFSWWLRDFELGELHNSSDSLRAFASSRINWIFDWKHILFVGILIVNPNLPPSLGLKMNIDLSQAVVSSSSSPLFSENNSRLLYKFDWILGWRGSRPAFQA